MREPPYDRARSVGTRRLASASMASTILPSMVGTSMAWVMPLVACGEQPVFGREADARDRHDAPADVGVAEHGGDAGDVERRHDDDGGFVVAGGGEFERVEHVGEELVVLEDRGLRLGRRAAREQEHRGPLGGVGEGAIAAVLHVEPVGCGHDRRLDPRHQLLERGLGKAVVERRVADAGPRGAEERGGHDRAVGLHQREALGAGAVDPVGDGAGSGAELLVGEAFGPGPERDPVPEGVGRHLEDHGDVHGSPPGSRCGGGAQSEDGSGFAWAISIATPWQLSSPSPALVTSTVASHSAHV